MVDSLVIGGDILLSRLYSFEKGNLMNGDVKREIDEYVSVLKERLDIENIKKHISSYNDDSDALEYFEEMLEDIDELVNDAEELVGNILMHMEEDED